MDFPWLILLLIVVVSFVAALKESLTGDRRKRYYTGDTRYEAKKNFLSTAERSFLGVLDLALGEEFRIFGKVRVSDLIDAKCESGWQTMVARSEIHQKHVDFIVCEGKSLQPVCAIELDDSSHKRQSTQKNDRVKNRVFSKAALPLVRFKAQSSYTIEDVLSNLAPILGLQGEKEGVAVSGEPPVDVPTLYS